MSPAFNPATGEVEMDLGYGPVALDAAFVTAVQDFIERQHDKLLRAEAPDRKQARALRLVSFDLIEAEVAQRQAEDRCPLRPIPTLQPLSCQVVRLRPELWGNGG